MPTRVCMINVTTIQVLNATWSQMFSAPVL